MPVLNEFYVNFGKKGVLLGMLIIGIIFGILTKFSNFPKHEKCRVCYNILLIYSIIFLESHLFFINRAIVQSYIFMMIISLILIKILRKFLPQ